VVGDVQLRVAKEAFKVTGTGKASVETLQRLLGAFNATIWTRKDSCWKLVER
jgi:hypothetical protein